MHLWDKFFSQTFPPTSGIEAGTRIGVKPNITAEQLADPEVDDLQVMAYAAGFQHPKAPAREIPKPVIRWGEFVKVYSVHLENQGDIDGMPGPMSIDSIVNQKVRCYTLSHSKFKCDVNVLGTSGKPRRYRWHTWTYEYR